MASGEQRESFLFSDKQMLFLQCFMRKRFEIKYQLYVSVNASLSNLLQAKQQYFIANRIKVIKKNGFPK